MYDMYPDDWARQRSRDDSAPQGVRRRPRRAGAATPEVPARRER